jgi:hypothetical protein
MSKTVVEISKGDVEEKRENAGVYAPKEPELSVRDYVSKRVDDLKRARKDAKLPGSNKTIEEIWKHLE